MELLNYPNGLVPFHKILLSAQIWYLRQTIWVFIMKMDIQYSHLVIMIVSFSFLIFNWIHHIITLITSYWIIHIHKPCFSWLLTLINYTCMSKMTIWTLQLMVTFQMDHLLLILTIILAELYKVIILAAINVRVYNINQYYQISICIVMLQQNILCLIYKITHFKYILVMIIG